MEQNVHQNGMSDQQVFDECAHYEEKEQDKPEPIADVGQVRDFDVMTLCK